MQKLTVHEALEGLSNPEILHTKAKIVVDNLACDLRPHQHADQALYRRGKQQLI